MQYKNDPMKLRDWDYRTDNNYLIKLTQKPYIDGTLDNPCYRALAVNIDDPNHEFEVVWDIVDENCDDESNACDWNHPCSIHEL